MLRRTQSTAAKWLSMAPPVADDSDDISCSDSDTDMSRTTSYLNLSELDFSGVASVVADSLSHAASAVAAVVKARVNRSGSSNSLDADEDQTYELAHDVKIPEAVVKRGEPFVACFERSKVMRSQVIVESGIIHNLVARALEVIPAKCHRSKIYVITDSVTDVLYAQTIMDGLESCGLMVTKLVIDSHTDESGEDSTEQTKTLATFSSLADEIIERGVDKNSCVISVGGGVTNNICGFLASSVYRGITLVHFSTTMMGQVDAAIDFKQAVNHHCGKNLLGAYYPAARIVLDPACLSTQTPRHLRNGLAEALKHGMVHSTDLLSFILADGGAGKAATAYPDGYLDGVVRRTIAVKVPTLTRYDESDFNEMAPQYGHAPAHAVEFLSWHGGCKEPLLHGEAVAIGMCVSAEVALLLGVCDEAAVEEHYRVCASVGLPTQVPPEMDLDAVCAKLAYDKHTLTGKPTMGLLVKLGQMYHDEGVYGTPIEADIIRRAFELNQARAPAH
jgi:3-dehydroquinate synthase